MRQRGTDSEDIIKESLEVAQKDIENSKAYGLYDRILVNDDLEATYEELEKYIFSEDAVERDSSPMSKPEDGVVEVLVTDTLADTSAELPTEMEI